MGERALEMSSFTLKAMANGGMHDHVCQVSECRQGGGEELPREWGRNMRGLCKTHWGGG